MTSAMEIETIILAAGLQTRYGSDKSKLMAEVQGKPVFDITIQSILANFPESLMTIISSEHFPDFNNHVLQNYPQARLVFDAEPGNGSAHSLRASLPWKSEYVFITEANIAYAKSLPPEMMHVLIETGALGVLAATNKLTAAETHKIITLTKILCSNI